jgi:hypothetical protein
MRSRLLVVLAVAWAACEAHAASPVERLRTLYRDAAGWPSYSQFQLVWGLTPRAESYAWTPIFKVTYHASQVAIARRADAGVSAVKIADGARPVNLDVRLARERTFEADFATRPVYEARVYLEGDRLLVGGFSEHCEKPVGEINARGRFVPFAGIKDRSAFGVLKIPAASLIYDPFTNRLLERTPAPAPAASETLSHFLPVALFTKDGREITGAVFSLRQVGDAPNFVLEATVGGRTVEIAHARATADGVLSAGPGYRPTLAPGCTQPTNKATVVIELKGVFNADNVLGDRASLTLNLSGNEVPPPPRARTRPHIAIDGRFDDWRNVAGVSDTQGDTVSYLAYNPDVDVLEFKIANDDRHMYFYSRVAGRHGNSAPPNGRYYWYVYADVDANPSTGYPPTRDDDCYFGVDLGDDSEAQFEFVGGRFIKTFFGFTGIGGEREVLSGKVTLGPSFYGKYDQNGRLRDRYKVEYVRRDGTLHITEDYTPGTSEDIVMALSADGSECEMRVEMTGYLTQVNGKPVLGPGSTLDAAVGAEASGEAWGTDRWGADSSPIIYGYRVQ